MLADVADEVEEREVFHPVVVVDHERGVGGVGVEVEEFGELGLDGFLVVAKRFFVEEVAFLAFHRGVADHAGCASDEGDGAMARALEVLEHHHAYEVADMEGVGRRVDAEVGRGHFFFELFFCAGHHLVNHATPGEFFDKIHRGIYENVMQMLFEEGESAGDAGEGFADVVVGSGVA